MALKRLSFDDEDNADPSDIDDDSVLADGMIPDSRIVGLIDELEDSCDQLDAKDEDDEIIADSQELH
ncbi:MAG: hypothetical protein KBF68_11320 [Nitrosomonas sp.]|mgnify:FL=1|uniref:Uncharacterized protein n=1 Tax=Nitrosomonas oligotropha TaxID=42354 RepID=A0A2T5HDZ5_9PROT|nr:hypothetical protein [Nitrosomonas oligotropha]MBK7493342.1 hypothetical protein [Nitrosomonas sp.]MBP9101932.1 hypothetical protein [Nitrosomonas sp.]PTQ69788.1 hypothetical protein C8R26_13321 [Nitrosomonas oligotropha]